MGFLSGAYGKLMAGKRVRDIQHQLTRVSSRLRRVTREIGDKEKMYQSMERQAKQMFQSQMYNNMYVHAAAICGTGLPNGTGVNTPLSRKQQEQLMMLVGSLMGGQTVSPYAFMGSQFDNNVTMAYSMIQSSAQMQFTSNQSMYQNIIEMQKEADLEALKDVEDELQTEKDNLESQLQIANEEYKAKKEEEKAGAKDLAPDYTGQG